MFSDYNVINSVWLKFAFRYCSREKHNNKKEAAVFTAWHSIATCDKSIHTLIDIIASLKIFANATKL